MKKKLKLSTMQWSLVAIITGLLVLRAIAPWAGKKYINNVLQSDLEHYTGSIQDFDLLLIAGQYTLEGFELHKKNVPESEFIAVKDAHISLNWKELLSGKLLMDIDLNGAKVNFIDGQSEKSDVSGAEESKKNWKTALDEIVPLSIQNFKVRNSQVNLQIGALKNLVASRLTDIDLEVLHLVDPEKQDKKLSPFTFKGKLNDHAKLKATGGINIVNDAFPFDINAELNNFRLESTNALLKHYIPIDVQKGSLDVIFESYGSVDEGKGYFKTFFKNLELFKIDQNYISNRHILFEYLGGFANWMINAMTEGEVATEIPFLWTPAGFDVDSSEAFWNLIENSGENLKKAAKEIGPLDELNQKRTKGPDKKG